MSTDIKPTQKCLVCGKTKRIEEYHWSKKKQRPIRTCKECCAHPANSQNREELALYLARTRSLMEEIAKGVAAARNAGEPLHQAKLESASLGEIFLSEITEEAYRDILRALSDKAKTGDVNAIKLLLEERHRRLGEPSPESVEETWDDLLRIDPLTTGLDSE